MTPTETQIARAERIADKVTDNSFAFAIAYEAALAAIMECEAWQDIESAPRDGTRVMLSAPSWQSTHCGVFCNGWTPGYDLPPFLREPTHWRPLPAPPIAAAIRAGGQP